MKKIRYGIVTKLLSVAALAGLSACTAYPDGTFSVHSVPVYSSPIYRAPTIYVAPRHHFVPHYRPHFRNHYYTPRYNRPHYYR